MSVGQDDVTDDDTLIVGDDANDDMSNEWRPTWDWDNLSSSTTAEQQICWLVRGWIGAHGGSSSQIKWKKSLFSCKQLWEAQL